MFFINSSISHLAIAFDAQRARERNAHNLEYERPQFCDVFGARGSRAPRMEIQIV